MGFDWENAGVWHQSLMGGGCFSLEEVATHRALTVVPRKPCEK